MGPGVRPPFPAPPVEGKGRRIGWGLGIGAGVVLLVCGGGVAAAVGLATSASGALNEQAHVVVGKYLDTLRARDFDKAYGMLCEQARRDESAAEYRSRIAEMDPIARYQMGELNIVDMSVPVDVTHTGGGTEQLDAYLGQNRETGAFEVCDLGE